MSPMFWQFVRNWFLLQEHSMKTRLKLLSGRCEGMTAAFIWAVLVMIVILVCPFARIAIRVRVHSVDSSCWHKDISRVQFLFRLDSRSISVSSGPLFRPSSKDIRCNPKLAKSLSVYLFAYSRCACLSAHYFSIGSFRGLAHRYDDGQSGKEPNHFIRIFQIADYFEFLLHR